MISNAQHLEADGTWVTIIDHGDGTATRTVWTSPAEEAVVSTELIAWPVTPDPEPVMAPGSEADLLDRAEQARRAAYDAVMEAGTRSMARLEESDRAGSEAFRAVLQAGA